MIFGKKKKIEKKIIDISSPQGNALYLLGFAETLSKKLKWDTTSILQEMQSGEYTNLLKVFKFYFEDYIIIKK